MLVNFLNKFENPELDETKKSDKVTFSKQEKEGGREKDWKREG